MLPIYNTGILLYSLIIRIFALFNNKARLFINGRKKIFDKIQQEVKKSDKHIWFHFASLGEFEQGRTVLEACKLTFPDKKIVLTFFSPSGYEIRKNYAHADHIWYLPLDTKKNAQKFIQLINPEFVVFTKYDFWFHYFNEVQLNKIPLYLIAGSFRPNQLFFKWYGTFYKNILNAISYFFLQNEESKSLLNKIGFTNALTTGDTRFDRVIENSKHPIEIPIAENFTKHHKTLICGSTWPPDEAILEEISKELSELKFIIAPHEIAEERLKSIETKFNKSMRFSYAKTNSIIDFTDIQILIIDNIGMLSSLYQYGEIAYIGGGFGSGLHNTQEPAAFGKPVIVGPDHYKFKEVAEMIEIGACKSIHSATEMLELLKSDTLNVESGNKARNYILQQGGATKIVMDYLKKKHS